MSTNSSQRSTREWPLLLLALAVVLGLCIPLYQATHENSGLDLSAQFSSERLSHLLLGPEQIICYCCFLWAIFILFCRWMEIRRQRRAFTLNLLPTEEGTRILPEDARPLMRKTEQLSARGGPYILSGMIRMILGKYAVSRSSKDATETVTTQADIELGRLTSSMSTINYLAWAIPALGFVGTVRGLGMSLAEVKGVPGEDGLMIINLAPAISSLNFAFDTTLVALLLSMPLLFMIHSMQRDEEGLILDCQEYCLANLVARLYDLEAEHLAAEARP